ERPKMIVAGATAYSRIIDFAAFREIADEVGALFLVDAAHIAGLIVGGAHPSPAPYADIITLTTHKTLRGPRAGCILCREEYAAAIDKAVFPGLQGGPLMHVIAAKAVAFHEAGQPGFRDYAAGIVRNARALASGLDGEGFRIVSGGTDNHLMLVDLRPFGVTGKLAQEALDDAGITVNKNAIPNDPEKPFVTSGLRLGTAAVTTAGMREPEVGETGRDGARRGSRGREGGTRRGGRRRAGPPRCGEGGATSRGGGGPGPPPPASARSTRRTRSWPGREPAGLTRGGLLDRPDGRGRHHVPVDVRRAAGRHPPPRPLHPPGPPRP